MLFSHDEGTPKVRCHVQPDSQSWIFVFPTLPNLNTHQSATSQDIFIIFTWKQIHVRMILCHDNFYNIMNIPKTQVEIEYITQQVFCLFVCLFVFESCIQGFFLPWKCCNNITVFIARSPLNWKFSILHFIMCTGFYRYLICLYL